MPALRYYVVTETREVSVTAASPLDALKKGSEVLSANSNATIAGSVRSPIRTKQLSVKED